MLPFFRDFLLATRTYVVALHLPLKLRVRRYNLPLESPLDHPPPHRGLPREVRIGCPTRAAIAPALSSASASSPGGVQVLIVAPLAHMRYHHCPIRKLHGVPRNLV
jgi:hypothetical protein